MSDLISRSELLKAFNNKNVQITFDLPVEEVLGEDVDLDDFAMLVQDAIQAYKKMVIDTIKNQPTSYSVDKVIEELNELDVKSITRYKNGKFGNFDGVEYYIKKRKAIEIVKQGGVSDDVCKWESDYGFISDKYKRETGCGYTFYDLHHAVPFKYLSVLRKKDKGGGMMERLTIDEAIAFCHEKSNNIKLKTEPQVFIQLGELLEELKKRRSEDYGYMADIHQSIGYRKALDDFTDKIISLCDDGEFMNRLNEFTATTILEIAEQLRAGGDE